MAENKTAAAAKVGREDLPSPLRFPRGRTIPHVGKIGSEMDACLPGLASTSIPKPLLLHMKR
jgi:hypothetical protein